MSPRITYPALLGALVLAACGHSGPEQPPPTPAASAAQEAPAMLEPFVGELNDPQRAAERRARTAFFEFELTDVDEHFGGDWIAFEEHKVAELRERAANRRWSPRTPLAERTPEVARATDALLLEYERVVLEEEAAGRRVAAAVAAAILAGDVATITQDCVMYSPGEERIPLCEAYLREHLPAMQRALSSTDPATDSFGASMQLRGPNPGRGQPASLTVRFGPEAEAPEGQSADPPLYPATHEIVLTWSGPVMPEANGPLHTAPEASIPQRGRWRFSSFVFPRSRRRGLPR